MALVPLIDVPLPPNVMIIFRFMAAANGDFDFIRRLPNVFREKQIINLTELEAQQPLNKNFEFTGYESGSLFLLQELKTVFFVYFLAFMVLCIVVSLFLSAFPRW